MQTTDSSGGSSQDHPAPNPAAPGHRTPEAIQGLVAEALREHLGVCNALLELAHKESDALNNPAPFPAKAIQIERKALLTRLESALRLLVQKRTLWQQSGGGSLMANPQVARLLQIAMDTIMRVLVIDRENEQLLLRRGLLPARALPAAEQSRPNFVANLYQRHSQS
jgi:hypothetical protein